MKRHPRRPSPRPRTSLAAATARTLALLVYRTLKDHILYVDPAPTPPPCSASDSST